MRLIDGDNKTFQTKVIKVTKRYFVVEQRKLNNKLFIYGKQVDDLLTVDYDALSILAISSIQALDKRLNDLKSKLRKKESGKEAGFFDKFW